MVLSMKSMKTVMSSNSHHLPSLRVGGAALIAFGAYIALNVERCDFGMCSAGIQLHNVETVPLAACPVAKKGANKKGKKTVDDLVMDHNQLGFAASELIENVARPLERVWSEHRANITRDSCDFPSFRASVLNTTNLSQPLGYTLADSFTNFSSNPVATTVVNATNTTINSTIAYAVNTTAYAVNTTASVVSCVSNTFTNTLKKSSASLKQRYAMKDVFQKSHRGIKTGAVRFATNDAVEKIRSIFSHCPESVGEEGKLSAQVGSKYSPEVSYVRSVGPAKKIFNTIVADGWGIEARVVNGLWTDVLVTKDEFELRLKRDKVGLLWAVVDGVVVGEV